MRKNRPIWVSPRRKSLRRKTRFGTRLQVCAGPALADLLALLRLLVSLRKGDVLFIDEIHGLARPVAECLYQAIDERAVSVPIICGSEARLVKLRLEPFFLIGATTEMPDLPKPVLSRFAMRDRLDLYALGNGRRAAPVSSGAGFVTYGRSGNVLYRF